VLADYGALLRDHGARHYVPHTTDHILLTTGEASPTLTLTLSLTLALTLTLTRCGGASTSSSMSTAAWRRGQLLEL
jgi:hypothetical protein